ncbi:MAG: hypothetical protein WBD09_10935 [Halobacteriota archaeon]
MEAIIINKLMLLGILAVIGIGMVAAAYATGIAEQLPISFQANVTTVIDEGKGALNLIYEGEVLQSLKLPEEVTGVKFPSADNGGISLKYLTKAEQSEALDKAIRIAESCQRIQSLIAGKEYRKLTRWMSQGEEGAIAKLVFAAGDKQYEVTVDVNNEKVVNIEEAKKFNDTFYYIYIINTSSCSGDDGDGTNENECSRQK